MGKNTENIQALVNEGVAKIKGASDEQALEALRVMYIGRKGLINDLFMKLKEVPNEEKKAYGQSVNQAKTELEAILAESQRALKNKSIVKQLEEETIDVTLPARDVKVGRIHPVTKTINEISSIFMKMGFKVAEGPEIETEYYNFDALNIPDDHPARDMHDTIYIRDHFILRTHTSPVQIRVMEKCEPPVAIICPGKAYRSDAIDASHSPMFHQMEGLRIDEGISFAHLKQVLLDFVAEMFGKSVKVRFRPSFFPFTEPSAEVDISCVMCKGEGCRVCSHKGWLEILGSGMVNPRVLEEVGYDSEKYTGFAFGMGIERIAMLKYRVNDIRLFYENDVRFLDQF